MSATVVEWGQYVGTNGKPFVNGKAYFGEAGSDPTLANIDIFSERSLDPLSQLPNPIDLDDQGRTVDKVWVASTYSLQIDDEFGSLQFIDLDAGSGGAAGISTLGNVLGINDLTADGSPTITAYIDKQQYTFTIANNNTDAMTLDIDNLGAKPIVRNIDQDIVPGQFVQNEIAIVQYNIITDQFYWVQENQKVQYMGKGDEIASGALVDLALATGNSPDIAGNAGPITSFGIVDPGAVFNLLFKSNPIIESGVGIITPDGNDISIKSGDTVTVVSVGSDVWKIISTQSSGLLPAGYIDGLQLQNDNGDLVNDIAVLEGVTRDLSDPQNIELLNPLVKQIDNAWAEGSGVGGFPSGLTLTDDTWYHFFVIKNLESGVVDAGYDTDLDAVNLLADAAGYTAFRRVGSIYRDVAFNKLFVQTVDWFYWQVLPVDVDPPTGVLVLLTPPGVETLAQCVQDVNTPNAASGSMTLRVNDGGADTTDTGGGFQGTGTASGDNGRFVAPIMVMTDKSSQVWNIDGSGNTINVSLKGYQDFRGKR